MSFKRFRHKSCTEKFNLYFN